MIAILGTGKMGEALLSGLLRAGHPPAEVLAVARRADRAAELRERYGVQTPSAAEAAKTAETLVLAVKPQDMGALLDEIAAFIPASSDRLVISVAAGITTAFIGRRLTGDVPVVRVMSNTPVLVDEAMSVISAGQHAGEAHLRRTEKLLRPVGKVLRIPGIAAGRRHRTVWQRTGLRVLPGGSDGGCRDPARGATRCGDGDGHPGGVRGGHDAPRVG